MRTLRQKIDNIVFLKRIALAIFLIAVLIASSILLFRHFVLDLPKAISSDGGFLSQKPCGPPCFQGIYPGVTTEQEARSTLQGLDLPCTDWDHTSEGGFRGVDCNYVTMDFENQKVGFVSFYPTSDLTISQILETYGPPDHILIFISSVLPDETQKSNATLFYDRLQVALDLTNQTGSAYSVQGDTVISNILYLTQERYQAYIDSKAGKIISWKGYGTFEAISSR